MRSDNGIYVFPIFSFGKIYFQNLFFENYMSPIGSVLGLIQ